MKIISCWLPADNLQLVNVTWNLGGPRMEPLVKNCIYVLDRGGLAFEGEYGKASTKDTVH